MAFHGDIINPAMQPININKKSITKSRKRGRWRRFVLISLLGIYALMGWLRLHGALTYRDYFTALNIWPRPVYFAISGGMIGFTFTLAVITLFLKWCFAAIYTRWLAVAFLLWFWVDRIWLSVREAFFNQLEIGVLITLATLFWAFILIRRKDLQQKSNTRTDDGLIPPQSGDIHPMLMHGAKEEENGEQIGTGSQILPE